MELLNFTALPFPHPITHTPELAVADTITTVAESGNQHPTNRAARAIGNTTDSLGMCGQGGENQGLFVA